MAEGLQLEIGHNCCEEKAKKSPLAERLDPVYLYIDGSCHRTDMGLKAGCAVVEQDGIDYVVQSQRDVTPLSAQRPELEALLDSLQIGKVRHANIYTDSAFTYYVVHTDLGSWIRNGWKTAKRGAPKHEDLLREVLLALCLP